MNRNAIHFSIGFNWENQVKSGMRLSCDIFIEIKFAHRHDSPGCLEVEDKKIDLKEDSLKSI